jgi:ABC-2 type transport system permease protein
MEGAKYSHEVLEQFFYRSSGMVMIASVLLTMRTISEERTGGTLTLLRTSPVAEWEIIAGKYIASMGILTLLIAATVHMPAMIFVHGKVSLEHMAVGYLGLFAIGSAVVAVGIFCSSLFKSQMAAAVLAGVTVVTLLVLWLLSAFTEPPFSDVFAYSALFDKHFVPLTEGKLKSTSLVYYASVTMLFLMMATRSLEGRRWE